MSAGEWLKDLLFPRRCPVCDRPVLPAGALICEECAKTLHPVGRDTCMCCGKPVAGRQELCADCAKRPHIFTAGTAVYTFRSCSGALYRFKYRGREEYADFFGESMARRLRVWQAEGPGAVRRRPPEALIAVPSSGDRVRRRGYDQSLLLARAMSRRTGIPVLENVLLRTRSTPPMRGMPAAERQKNLKKAFLVHGNSVESKSIMLIDDIYTTGATMDACAEQLRKAGSGPVFFMTLAIGEIPYVEPGQDPDDDTSRDL